MPDNEITVEVEPEPRFTFQKKVGETNVFSFAHLPHIGLINPEPCALLVPGLAFACFNPSSLEFIKMVKVGDLINVTSDNTHPIYLAWDPPKEYQIEDNFSKLFRVRKVDTDQQGYPIFLADLAL